MGRLTKRSVEALAPVPGRSVLVWDTEMPGYGVRVTPAGIRAYVVQYRTASGATRRLTIGRHGPLTAEAARKKAQTTLAAVAAGRDPAAEKASARDEAVRQPTLAEVAERWKEYQQARVSRGKLRARTLREYGRQLNTEIIPRLGKRRLAEVTTTDVQAMFDTFASRPVLGNRVVDLFAALWTWSEARGFASGSNPCKRVDRNQEQRRSRALSHAELGRLGTELRESVAARKVEPRVALLIRVIALTGCRPGEVKSLAWADVDFDRSVIRLRDAKTGDRDCWLSGPARAALEAVKALPVKTGAESSWCFPSRRDHEQHVGEFRKPWAALLKAAKIEAGPPYILRHGFASESEAAGHSALLTAHLLGHSTGRMGMTAGYIHHLPVDVRNASERVARRIASALDAEGAAVIRLRKKTTT